MAIRSRVIISISDVRDIVRDLSAIGIMQSDLRYCNVLQASNAVICPRHGRAHRWRPVDFDMAAKAFISPLTSVDSGYAQRSQVRVIGTPSFWGWS